MNVQTNIWEKKQKKENHKRKKRELFPNINFKIQLN